MGPTTCRNFHFLRLRLFSIFISDWSVSVLTLPVFRGPPILKSLSVAVLILSLAGTATAQDLTCPTARNDVSYVYAPPRMAAEVLRLSTRVEPGAVIAVEIQGADYTLRKTDRVIETTAPLAARFETGTTIGRRQVDGVMRDCVYRGLRPYQPPVDEDGRPFPTVCLEDSDSDGGYETLRFFAYRAAAGRGIIEAAISPVRLLPFPAAADPMESLLLVHRRLRVLSVAGNHARFVVEHAYTYPPRGDVEPSFLSSSAGEVGVELREGALEVAGLRLHAVHLGESWTVTPTGGFRPWIDFVCEGAELRLGAP